MEIIILWFIIGGVVIFIAIMVSIGYFVDWKKDSKTRELKGIENIINSTTDNNELYKIFNKNIGIEYKQLCIDKITNPDLLFSASDSFPYLGISDSEQIKLLENVKRKIILIESSYKYLNRIENRIQRLKSNVDGTEIKPQRVSHNDDNQRTINKCYKCSYPSHFVCLKCKIGICQEHRSHDYDYSDTEIKAIYHCPKCNGNLVSIESIKRKSQIHSIVYYQK